MDTTTTITISPRGEGVYIKWDFYVYEKEDEGSGLWNCYIPGFDIYYNAYSRDHSTEIAGKMTKAFFGHYLDESNKDSLREVTKALIDLGFKPDVGLTAIRDLYHNKVKHRTNFNRAVENDYASTYGNPTHSTGDVLIAA